MSAVVSYCVRLNSLDRSATVVERRNPVPRERLERVLKDIDAVGGDPGADPAAVLERLACCGSLLGDDILYGIGERLAEVVSSDGRPIHLVLQMPRELMRYPWELLRDRHGWLIERFALGRQVIADADSIPRWCGTRRRGPLRFLVVAPAVGGSGAEVSNVGILEGEHVAGCFERLQERLPGSRRGNRFSGVHRYASHRRTLSDAAPRRALRHRALRRPRPLRCQPSRA